MEDANTQMIKEICTWQMAHPKAVHTEEIRRPQPLSGGYLAYYIVNRSPYEPTLISESETH